MTEEQTVIPGGHGKSTSRYRAMKKRALEASLIQDLLIFVDRQKVAAVAATEEEDTLETRLIGQLRIILGTHDLRRPSEAI